MLRLPALAFEYLCVDLVGLGDTIPLGGLDMGEIELVARDCTSLNMLGSL